MDAALSRLDRQRPLQQLCSKAAAILLLLVASCHASEFLEGDFVPAARRAQFEGQRTHWHDVLGTHCPKFGVSRLVVVPLPQPVGYKATDDYKLQLSFDGDRHLTPWLPIIGKRAASPPYVEVVLTRSGSSIVSVTSTVYQLDDADQKQHAAMVNDFLNATHWPKHLLVHYTWHTRHEEDEEAGLLVLFSAGAVAALLLGLNVARTYQEKLRQFLADVTGDQPMVGAPEKGIDVWCWLAFSFTLSTVSKQASGVRFALPVGASDQPRLLAAMADTGRRTRTAVIPRPAPSLAVTVTNFPRRHPQATFVLLAWLLGLYFAFLARPIPVTEAQTLAFKGKVKEAEGVLYELTRAEQAVMEAELDQAEHKVWFWRFKEAARKEVHARQPAVEKARAKAQEIRSRHDKLIREGKAVLGVFSEAGVEEGRELFWSSFTSGKVFAQRQSFFDAIFTILDRRERDWLGMLLQLLFQTVLNFVTGLSVSVFVFLAQLPSLIWSYQPTLWAGISFFVLAGLAAVSVVASFLGLLVGAGGALGYSLITLTLQQQARVEGQAQQRRVTQGDNRAHTD
ncbi:hypothetical protein ACK3TF_001057 [Chlorella vulgaris]